VSDFDSLRGGSFLKGYDREGCETRLRDSEPSAGRDDMDAKVLAVGGDWVAVAMPQSEGLRPGRMFRRAQPPPQYVYRIAKPALS
jgi:hypothetical protein